MTMKKRTTARYVKPIKKEDLCQHHNRLGAWAAGLNRLPDADQVKKQKPQCVPRTMLPMIF